MSIQTIPPIEEMTSDQLADLLDAVQVERFKRRNEPLPEWHLRILEVREDAIARGESEYLDLADFKEQIRKEVSEKLEEKDREEVVEALRRATEDVKAGRVTPAELVFREFEEKYGIPHNE